jgi:hypothetical protein
VIAFAPNSTSVNVHERASSATLTIVRTGPDVTGSSTVKLTTMDGTATAPTNYDAVSGTITFQPGEPIKQIGITVHDDGVIDPTKDFTVALSDPAAATLGAATTATVHVLNDDVPASATGAGGGQGAGATQGGKAGSKTTNRPPRSRIARLARRARASRTRVIRGTASDADRDLASVSIAIVRVSGGTHAARARTRPVCMALAANGRLRRIRLVRGRCRPAIFLRARGAARWSFRLRRLLPTGSYVVYSRARDRDGLVEKQFSRRLGNRVAFVVLK